VEWQLQRFCVLSYNTYDGRSGEPEGRRVAMVECSGWSGVVEANRYRQDG
jgi:hypothetical protein